MDFVYVFHGEGARLAAAVYPSFEVAKSDIGKEKLTGLLTAYPFGETVFRYCVYEGLFDEPRDTTPKFVQRFTSGQLEHYHFENGELA